MKTSEFAKKLLSKYLWGNLFAMLLIVIAIAFGVRYGLDVYTHHGERIAVPMLHQKSIDESRRLLSNLGLTIEVADTGYVRNLPPDCILSQSPEPGEYVKSGRVVYVTINASHTPTITLPDVIDNSSLREAVAKLRSIGFKVGDPVEVPGEKDWVYGITVNGRHVATGDRIPIDAVLIIEVGSGIRSLSDSVDYVDPNPVFEDVGDDMEEDPFEEVVVPSTTTTKENPEPML